MNEPLHSQLKTSTSRIPDLFWELGDDAYFVNSECVITKNRILDKNRIYEIADFLDMGKIQLKYIKLLHAYLKGFEFYLFGIDITTGDVIKRNHRLDSEYIICDWVIVDLDVFDKEVNEDMIIFSCNRKQALNDNRGERD